ncbi:MAG TPA: PHP-associated domain-containing protein [Dehalococcoidia bacterium]|nr:PHP-associated domain-containing protein [Dehalococcoidia bacterium]
MGKADLHIHTNHGDGLDSVQAIFEHVEAHTDLDLIALTEHDSLEVALRARELWARGGYRFDLVPGVEITTLEGHLVALYLETPVPSLRRIEETLEAVHAQNGVCFVPHPMSWLTRSIGPGSFERVAAAGLSFDAIELASGSPPAKLALAKARRLNRQRYRLPSVGASDAHFRQAIGSGYTRFEGSSAIDLRAAFADGTVRGKQRDYPSLREAGLLRTLSLPIAGLRATPKQLGWRRTAWSFVSRYAPR